MMAYRSRLLTILKPKGFNPLSLNPTLLLDPANSYSRTGGQFTAASSQYLSVASNSDVQTGDVDFWIACWFYADSLGSYCLVSKDTNTSREYTLMTGSNGSNLRVQFFLSSGGSSIVNSAYSASINTWNFVLAGYSAADDLLYVILNGVRTAAAATTPAGVGAAEFRIGAKQFPGAESFHNGRLDNVLFGKSPTPLGDGTSGSLAHTIATTLFNSNNGLAFQDITAQQQSDWGIVSGWLDNSLTADAFGSNTLTNNNGVTQAAGKVNAIAVENDPVYQGDDSSGNGDNATQINLANRPLFDAAVPEINNRPAWIFDGTNDSLQLLASVGGLSALTMLAVVKYNDAGANQQAVNCNTSLAGFQQFSSAKYVYAGAGIYGSYADTDTGWNILVSRYDGSQTGNTNRLKAYQNGGTAKTLSFTGTVPATLGAGSGNIWIGDLIVPGTAPHNGGVAYLIIIPTTLADTQLNQLGTYLATKFGLSWTDI